MFLNNAKESTKVVISNIDVSNEVLIKLMSMGIGKGRELDIVKNNTGNVIVKNGESRIGLGSGISSLINVNVK